MARARHLLIFLVALVLAWPLAAAPVPVAGRVAGPRGEPVAGARVSLVRQAASHELGGLHLDGAGPEPAARAETDREGRVVVKATRAGYAAAERILDLGAEGGAEEVDLQLQATEGIRFQVASATGLPVGAVVVAVVGPAGRVVAGGQFNVGAEGEVRVSTVPAGTWELLVRQSEGGGANLSVPITAPGALGRLQLSAGGDLEVIVPALNGGAVAATATLRGPDGRPYREPSWGGEVRASWPIAGGRAHLSALPAGRLTVTVTAADGRTWTGEADVRPGGRAQVSLN